MTEEELQIPDPDMDNATIALIRASKRARQLAARTGTEFVVMRNDKLVREIPKLEQPDQEKHVCNFDQLLKNATKAIEKEYFLLPVTEEPDPVHRERVYCYELYHQLRQRWNSWTDNKYCLNGEVDKARHPYAKSIGALKPDLLVHTPGSNDNYAVLEIKPAQASKDKILEDAKKLVAFTKMEHPYKRAILLVYGELSSSILKVIQQCPERKNIELWLHETHGEEAQQKPSKL